MSYFILINLYERTLDTILLSLDSTKATFILSLFWFVSKYLQNDNRDWRMIYWYTCINSLTNRFDPRNLLIRLNFHARSFLVACGHGPCPTMSSKESTRSSWGIFSWFIDFTSSMTTLSGAALAPLPFDWSVDAKQDWC